MKKFKYKLEIEIIVDEDKVSRKYPNYKINYNNVEEFANSFIKIDKEQITDDTFNKFGYEIKTKIIKI